MPQAQTVAQPPRIPLVTLPGNRDDSVDKDARLVNCYAENIGEKDYDIYKRPGMLERADLSKTGAGQGLFSWKTDIYAVFAGTLYKNGASLGAVDGTNGTYRFSVNNQTAPASLQLSNGVAAYNYDPTNGLVEITDVDFVTPHVKGWAYLDGTTYYMDEAGAIRGSEIGDTVNWDALNKIIAQIEPDGGVALAKQLVYLVAFKEWTTEAFYDAGNATGSPLGPVQGAKVNYGALTEEGIQDLDGALLFVGISRLGGPQIVMLDNLRPAVVSTKAIDRLLDGQDGSQIMSWGFKQRGHRLYGVTLIGKNLTLVFDLEERLWYQWTDAAGDYLPIIASSTDETGRTLFQHATNGKIYSVDDSYTSDDGAIIPVDIITPNFDAGTRRKKHLGSMLFVADRTEGSYLDVRVSDDDYESWSNFRRVDLAISQPIMPNCGTFRRRAWHFRHRADTRFRIKAIELQLDIGTL